MTVLLEARGVTKRFGGLVAVNAVDFSISEHTIASLIGPNGAGKTTLFNVIAGLYRPTAGSLLFADRQIAGLPMHTIAASGITRTFQNIRLFARMSARDNVLVGMHTQLRASPLAALLRLRSQRREEREAEARAGELLDYLGIENPDEWAGNLPYGEQRRLELARALAGKPRLLLLDEPTAGMNPLETSEMMRLIARLRDELGLTILLIEHDMKVVMGISDQVTVLDHGEKIAGGTPHEVQRNPLVIEAYLGRAAAATTEIG